MNGIKPEKKPIKISKHGARFKKLIEDGHAEPPKALDGEIQLPRVYPLGRPTKYNAEEMIPKVMRIGRAGGTKAMMAAEIDVPMKTFLEWEKTFPEFSKAVQMARTYSQAKMESLGLGIAEGVVDGNSAAWQFIMKNQFPEQWRDVKETINTNEHKIVRVDVRTLGDEQRAAIRAAIEHARQQATEQPEDGDE
jgi:hypothetical protein